MLWYFHCNYSETTKPSVAVLVLWCVLVPLLYLAQRQLAHRFLHAMGGVCCRPCNEDVTELVPEDDGDFVITDGVERWVTVQACVN